MTLRGMIRISALGAVLLAACALASSVARGQTPQVSIDPRPKQDTIVQLSPTKQSLLFGFSGTVVDATGIPTTAPMRAFCVRAQVRNDVVLVDGPVTRVEPEMPTCVPAEVPLVIRPTCELTPEENMAWRVKRERPVIVLCGVPPQVFLLTKPGYP